MTLDTSAAGRVEPTSSRDRPAVKVLRRFWGPIATATVALAALTMVVTRNPHIPGGGIGECPLHAATGLWCPGCGGTRAVYDLAHLNVVGALSMNPLVALAVPLIVVLWARWVLRLSGREMRPWPFPGWAGGALGALIIAFTIGRNLPILSPWLAP